MKIPVFHDDQHGTAIISGAALLNALESSARRSRRSASSSPAPAPRPSPAPSSTCSSASRRENIILCDTHGRDLPGPRPRTWTPTRRRSPPTPPARTLADALAAPTSSSASRSAAWSRRRCSRAMARDPIVFALANPDPEISYEEARAARAGRHRGHRPQRLSQPGQQRPRLPLPLPRRARRAGDRHQRRDEARRGPGPGRARPRGRARRGARAPTASSRSASAAST